MFNREKPVKKKDKLSHIKRWLAGEDVLSEILPMSHAVAMMTTDELNKFRLIRQYGVEPIEGMAFEQDGVKIDFREWAAIQEKLKSAVIMLPVRSQELKETIQAETKGIIWEEERTYSDPEISNVRYSSPDAIVDDFKPIVASEHSRVTEMEETTRKQTKCPETTLRIERFNKITEQQRQDVIRRDKMNTWTRMNGSLRPL